MNRLNYRVGSWVEILSLDEILGTLDGNACLDGMPFMPEMAQFCGRRFQVHKSAHKGCDTIFPVRSRWVDDAVHLQTRCDGQAHDGCQAGCRLYWKTAWLKAVDGPSSATGIAAENTHPRPASAINPGGIDLARLRQSTIARHENGVAIYRCQATQLPYASRDLKWWDVRQYVLDYQSGNVGLWTMLCGVVYAAFDNVANLGIGLGRPMRWFYNTFHWVWRGVKYPRTPGAIPAGAPTPTAHLNLQPGEAVRVKPHDEILKTVNVENKNRGMWWDAELVPFCGGTYKVLRRVTKVIDEKRGHMVETKNPCIILENVFCRARFSNHRMFCPRELYPFWREIWLERVEGSKSPP